MHRTRNAEVEFNSLSHIRIFEVTNCDLNSKGHGDGRHIAHSRQIGSVCGSS